jgi:hypothetical protein
VIRRTDGCRQDDRPATVQDGLACRTWSRSECGSGREFVLCLHPGEHEIDARWIGDAVDWLDSLARVAAPPRP